MKGPSCHSISPYGLLLTTWWWRPASWWPHWGSRRSPSGVVPVPSCSRWSDQSIWRTPPGQEHWLHSPTPALGSSPPELTPGYHSAWISSHSPSSSLGLLSWHTASWTGFWKSKEDRLNSDWSLEEVMFYKYFFKNNMAHFYSLQQNVHYAFQFAVCLCSQVPVEPSGTQSCTIPPLCLSVCLQYLGMRKWKWHWERGLGSQLGRAKLRIIGSLPMKKVLYLFVMITVKPSLQYLSWI